MSEPLRILHFIPGFRFGGIESTFLAHCKNIDPTRYAFDLLTETTDDLPAFETLRNLGVRIHRIPRPLKKAPWRYFFAMKKFFATVGRHYKIVHSRVPGRSFPFLYYAKKFGVKHRVLHSHTTVPSDTHPYFYRYFVLPLNNSYATDYAACGLAAGRIFFGRRPFFGVKNGIDLTRFQSVTPEEIDRVREELKLPPGVKVVGNVGRFCYPKNFERMIDIFRVVASREKNIWLLLVGDGPDLPQIEQKVQTQGLQNRVIFTGRRSDVPVLLGLFDLLLMPSRYEGFGNVITEALASGLRCLISEVTPYPHYAARTFFRSLNDSDEAWADDVLAFVNRPKYTDGVEFIRAEGFDIADSARNLSEFYERIRHS